MVTERSIWEDEVARLDQLAEPSDRLGALRDTLAFLLSRIKRKGTMEEATQFPTLTVLRSVAAAVATLRGQFPTGEATLLFRRSQDDLLKWLTFLVWHDAGVIPLPSPQLNVHASFDTSALSESIRQELDTLRVVLNSMFDWRLNHDAFHRFAAILRSARREESESYRNLCDGIATGLRKTLKEGIGSLNKESFRETMDRLRELRTILQLRYASQGIDSPASQVTAEATVYVLPVLDQIGVLCYERDRVHFWCSEGWSAAVLQLDELMSEVELPHNFDTAADGLLQANETQLALILGDLTEPRRLRSVAFVDHIGRRLPIAEFLNAECEYGPPDSPRPNNYTHIVSYWGRVAYRANSQYVFDDEKRLIYDGSTVQLQYPLDPPAKFRPRGAPLPLLLSAYEKWFLEDLARQYRFELETYCDGTATRETFLNRATTGATILHLSTHGEAFPETWELSNLFLAHEEDLPARVHVFDLLAIDWSHLDLVFLNSCLTSAGKHASGEQPLSLAWAFLASGAKAVIATRWQIQDRVALRFMKSFYEHLLSQSNSSVPLAFQFARRQLKDDDRFGQPSQWMAFVLLQN